MFEMSQKTRKMKRKDLLLNLLMGIFCMFFFNQVQSQELAQLDQPVNMASELIAEEQTEENENEDEAPKLEISGFVDAYYQYSFNESPFSTSFTETHNSFTLGMANVVFAKTSGKVGFVADLAVGPRAEVANGYSGSTLSAIKQLFVTYSPSDAVTFTLGNFGTHVGYEVIDAPANINYSTSYMFSNGPFYHTGLKADFALSENFGAMIGIFNDTDTKIDEVPGKHFGAQLSYSNESIGIYLNYIAGKDVVDEENNALETGHQIDLTATFQLTDEFGLGVNATSKTNILEESENTNWYGAALYANYAFSDAFTLGLRGEYIGDGDGLILGAVDGSVFDFTVSGNIHLGPFTLIPEFRIDAAGKDVFVDANGAETGTSSALMLAAIYAF